MRFNTFIGHNYLAFAPGIKVSVRKTHIEGSTPINEKVFTIFNGNSGAVMLEPVGDGSRTIGYYNLTPHICPEITDQTCHLRCMGGPYNHSPIRCTEGIFCINDQATLYKLILTSIVGLETGSGSARLVTDFTYRTDKKDEVIAHSRWFTPGAASVTFKDRCPDLASKCTGSCNGMEGTIHFNDYIQLLVQIKALLHLIETTSGYSLPFPSLHPKDFAIIRYKEPVQFGVGNIVVTSKYRVFLTGFSLGLTYQGISFMPTRGSVIRQAGEEEESKRLDSFCRTIHAVTKMFGGSATDWAEMNTAAHRQAENTYRELSKQAKFIGDAYFVGSNHQMIYMPMSTDNNFDAVLIDQFKCQRPHDDVMLNGPNLANFIFMRGSAFDDDTASSYQQYHAIGEYNPDLIQITFETLVQLYQMIYISSMLCAKTGQTHPRYAGAIIPEFFNRITDPKCLDLLHEIIHWSSAIISCLSGSAVKTRMTFVMLAYSKRIAEHICSMIYTVKGITDPKIVATSIVGALIGMYPRYILPPVLTIKN